MALPASDAFTGAGALSASWTIQRGAISRVSNTAQATAGAENYAFWNADVFGTDHYSQGTVTLVGGDSSLTVRAKDVASPLTTNNNYDCYEYSTNGSSTAIARLSNGSWTQLAGGLGAIATGSVMRLEVTWNGSTNTLTAYDDGVVDGSTTDATHTGGSAGMGFYNAANSLDNWEGGNVGGGGTPQALASTGSVSVQGTAVLSVGKPLVAAGSVTPQGTAALLVQKALASAGEVVPQGTAALTVAKLLATAGEVAPQGNASLSVGKPLEVQGAVLVHGASSLTGAAELQTSGTVLVQGSASLTAVKPLASAGEVAVQGTIDLQVTRGLASSGTVQAQGGAVLEVLKLLSSSGEVLTGGAAELLVGELIILETITLPLYFQRAIRHNLEFTREITRELKF